MACGGFSCSKNALLALNILYVFVAVILIGVAAAGRWAAIFTSLSIMGGIIACGVFLLLIAVVGLVGAVKHHQVLLFFYMIILFLIFLIQFAVACACLAINKEQQFQLAATGWNKADSTFKGKVQTRLNCCGFNDTTIDDHPECSQLSCCDGHEDKECCGAVGSNSTDATCPCETCWSIISVYMDESIKAAGGVGIFFSFTEIIGVWLAVRYRNQKDPRANPSAFL